MDQAKKYKRFIYMGGLQFLLWIGFSVLTLTVYKADTIAIVVLTLLFVGSFLNVLLYFYYKSLYRRMRIKISEQRNNM